MYITGSDRFIGLYITFFQYAPVVEVQMLNKGWFLNWEIHHYIKVNNLPVENSSKPMLIQSIIRTGNNNMVHERNIFWVKIGHFS